MTDDERHFLEALAVNPADEVGWLAYADWLEEHDDPRSAYLRAVVRLASGAVPNEELEPFAEQLSEARKGFDAGWLDRVVSIRANQPFRFRVTSVVFPGHEPPQDMFGYARTIAIGVLEVGSLRPGVKLAIPQTDGTVTTKVLQGIETFAKSHEQARVGEEPMLFAFMVTGHHRGIRPFDVLTAATS